MPVRILITQGKAAGRLHVGWLLIEGLCGDLLADRGYGSNTIIEQARKQGMKTVVPSKKNCTTKRFYDKELYKSQHLVENAFLHLKRWRGIAQDTQKMLPPSSLIYKSNVSLSGQMSCDYTI
ncbi:MAG: hypothetical protein KF888_08595 [Nitrosomonas sp.]|nr:hypothetical protein [Nitrosomonas sp.]